MQPDPIEHKRSVPPQVAVQHTVVAAVAPDEHDDVLRIAWVRASTFGMRLVVCAIVNDAADVAAAYEAIQRRVKSIIPQGPEPVIEVRVGDRAEQLLECANQHDTELLVMGPASHREGILARFFSPSLPTAVVRRAEFPVLVTRYSPPTGRIVAAVELGDAMNPILQAAQEEMRRAGGKLHVLHCVAPMPVASAMEFPVAPPDGEMLDAARTELERAIAASPIPACDVKVEMGPAGQTILQHARDLAADLIVVGTHGRSGPARLLLGSIAEEVLRGAACNVMVVRSGSNA
ncbi:MAG TPA: universal stress protein [Kofleriaceae bacterium]|nr:universal stress protein [Kofleriaceae bacterium]